jgi:hypothetical protein
MIRFGVGLSGGVSRVLTKIPLVSTLASGPLSGRGL